MKELCECGHDERSHTVSRGDYGETVAVTCWPCLPPPKDICNCGGYSPVVRREFRHTTQTGGKQ